MKNNKYEENIFYYFASDLGSKIDDIRFYKTVRIIMETRISLNPKRKGRSGKRRDRDFGRDKRFEGIIIIATAREKEEKGGDAGER